MPVFDLVVVGCGGGPNESNLSSYLLKAHNALWSDGALALEAGSGYGAISRILADSPTLFAPCDPRSPAEVLSWVRSFVITHGHLDHINGLVLSAGSLRGPPRQVFAAQQTLKDIETVFSDRLWPNLGTWDKEDKTAALLYSPLQLDSTYRPVAAHVSVRALPLNHGHMRCTNAPYDSTAFFVRHDPSAREFLFFGDVQPDRLSREPRTCAVWAAAAPKLPHTLDTIFIECSYPLGRPDAHLYGHLSPTHLAQELAALAREVVAVRRSPAGSPAKKPRLHSTASVPALNGELRDALTGVRVFIIHCKEDLTGEFERPMHTFIAGQVQKLVDDLRLGATIVAAEQGMHITI